MTFDEILLGIFAANLLFFWALTFKKAGKKQHKVTGFYTAHIHTN